jgi:hypothetical protein
MWIIKYNGKEASLTFSSPFTRTTHTIGWNQSLISYNNLADRPTLYTQSQTDTLLNAKQNTLTAATKLLGIGSSITSINYKNITTNKLTFATPLSSNISTNVISIDLSSKENVLTFTSPLVRTTNNITFNETSITTLTNFYNKTGTNNLLNAKQNTLTCTTVLSGIGSNLTLINYATLSNIPPTFPLIWLIFILKLKPIIY